MDRARGIAINAYPGKVESAELEQEKGRRVYSFDIRRAGQADIHEILVDANTGEIISQTTETPAEQAAELKADAPYHVIKTIPIPGDGGWDYLTLDPDARRLYISHATQVQVLDIDQEKLVGDIPNTPGVHGVALAPDLGRGFTSNGKEGTVTIFDLKTLQTLGSVKVDAENPDAILYDASTRQVFTFNGHSSNATVIEAASGKIRGHIALDGKPEFAVADGKGTIYVNLEDKSILVRIDSKGMAVTARWPLAPCEEPSALAMDKENGRLFAGCGNKLMAVVDATNGKVLTTLPIGDHVDAAVFDPGTHQAFSSNGDGTLTVIQEDSSDEFHVAQNVQTQRGARTVALDPRTHKLYLADAQFGATPAPTADHPHPRPAIVPGTFVILVVKR